VANGVASAAQRTGAAAILTTDYETTAWLRFYEPGLKVVQLGELYRYPNAPMAGPELMGRPLLYFVEKKRDQAAQVRQSFSAVSLATELAVSRNGQEFSHYEVYLLDAPKGPISGRMP
jgi:hypothetical protein